MREEQFPGEHGLEAGEERHVDDEQPDHPDHEDHHHLHHRQVAQLVLAPAPAAEASSLSVCSLKAVQVGMMSGCVGGWIDLPRAEGVGLRLREGSVGQDDVEAVAVVGGDGGVDVDCGGRRRMSVVRQVIDAKMAREGDGKWPT